MDGFVEQVHKAEYPVAEKAERIKRFMRSSKPGTGIVAKRWENEINICWEHPLAN
jgi:hypothetical protein